MGVKWRPSIASVFATVPSDFLSVLHKLFLFFLCLLLSEEEESLVSGKSPKPAAAHHSASAPRSARVNTKIAVYGPQDASSAHSQGPLSFTSIWVFFSQIAVLVIFTIQNQRLPHPIDCFEWKQFCVHVCVFVRASMYKLERPWLFSYSPCHLFCFVFKEAEMYEETVKNGD